MRRIGRWARELLLTTGALAALAYLLTAILMNG